MAADKQIMSFGSKEDVVKQTSTKSEDANEAVDKKDMADDINKEEVKENISKFEEITSSYEEPVEDLNAPYVDNRKVTIRLVKSNSLYRKVNDKVIGKRVDFIGGSITSSRILSSNKAEIENYFPAIIGLAPNNPLFVTEVKKYLNNIRIPVDEIGKTFDVSFNYNRKTDYLRIKEAEDKIEATYASANRNNIVELKKAYDARITAINNLEATKHYYGSPVNVEDYLMYRHCILYNNVAKDNAFINSNPNIRFYFVDENREAEAGRRLRNELNKAKVNYIKLITDEQLKNAVYIQYCLMNNRNVLTGLAEANDIKEINLDKFSSADPQKFNKWCSNKNIKLIGLIETLIATGELNRSPYNQRITTIDGEFIGANMNEAISWFNDPNNSAIVSVLTNKTNR